MRAALHLKITPKKLEEIRMRTPIKFLIIAGILAVTGAVTLPIFARISRPEISTLPSVVTVPAGAFSIRKTGEYRIGNRVVDPPLVTGTARSNLTIMKYHVSQAEYALCVADGACETTETKQGVGLPQVAISYYDATAYARWFSEKTKRNWRLPTAIEWRRAAGDQYFDSGLGDLNDANDPAQRWLLEYARQVNLRDEPDLNLRPQGANGENNLGLADVSANVWEWTQTCYYNVTLETDGETELDRFENCMVRAVEGKHTAYITEFVRDANVGGCAAGIPPDFLGFRLVLDS